uniref:Uncharacterized protein n=1 Tax=Romanomermis culicivorax TaxID=13658 RepID=A0A915HL79_ROMCU
MTIWNTIKLAMWVKTWIDHTDDRQKFHESYWACGEDEKAKKQFLVTHIVKLQVKRRQLKEPANSRKQHSFVFYMIKNGEKLKVCKV